MGKKAKKQANASMALALQRAHIAEMAATKTEIVSPVDTAPSTVSSGSRKRSAPESDDETKDDIAAVSTENPSDNWAVVSNKRKKQKVPSTQSSNYPSITTLKNSRLQSKVTLEAWRDLVLYIFADGTAPPWVSVNNRSQIRKIVTLVIPGLEEFMFQKNIDYRSYDELIAGQRAAFASGAKIRPADEHLPRPLEKADLNPAVAPFADMFDLLWPIRAPGDDRYGKLHSPIGTFLSAPRPKSKDPKVKAEIKKERTRITEFIATEEELVENGYAIHPALMSDKKARENFKLEDGWVLTDVPDLESGVVPESEIEAGSVTAGHEILAMDCEMVMTGPTEMSLARISVLNWSGDIVLDELVKPSKPITDYVTQYSGMTAEKLDPVTTTLADIQAKLVKLITPRTILLGHSLDSDLKVLQLSHPFIIDTALIFPHPRGPPLKQALRFLTKRYLNREIQLGGANGHNSIEDARACLDLARQKCENGKHYGLPDGAGENLFLRLARTGTTYKAQGGSAAVGGVATGKTSAMIDWGQPKKGPGAKATYSVSCSSDEEVIDGVLRAINGDPDGAEIPGGGVDFVFARMRELEALRGWWNNTRDAANGIIPTFGPVSEDSAFESPLEEQLSKLTSAIQKVYDALPPCSALMVVSGSGDPRELGRLQAMHTQWKKEYNTPGSKWDQLSVKWTDVEEQLLRKEAKMARAGMGFVKVK